MAKRTRGTFWFWWLLGVAVVTVLSYVGRNQIGAAIDTLTGVAKSRALLLAELMRTGITSAKEQAMFIAQVHHESGGFKRLEESFRYTSSERLMAISAAARKAGVAAVDAALKAGPVAVAEIMYGGRMGNVAKGDAHRYRGRGFIQLTGRDNYAAAGRALGLDLIANPDAAATPEVAAKVAVWFWKLRVGAVGASGDTVAVTKKINGGTIGLIDRQELYAKYLADANAGTLS
ncbi:MAG: hypothetical protein RLZZ182_1843 [Pseudomonadota bacterium]|jgi:putative chitinase